MTFELLYFIELYWIHDLLCVCVCSGSVHSNITKHFEGGVFTYDVYSGVF